MIAPFLKATTDTSLCPLLVKLSRVTESTFTDNALKLFPVVCALFLAMLFPSSEPSLGML